MKTAQFQVFTAQRFPSIDTFMKQADGSEIIIKQEGNMFAFYEGEKKLLESIWQTYAAGQESAFLVRQVRWRRGLLRLFRS
jgi:hypothetical protein